MTLAQQYQELVDAGYSPEEARSYVVPAGDSQYSTNELINKGGFIGDPNQPGSNTFDPTLGRQTTNVLPPWMVQPAGQAASIPGINAQSASDFQDAYGIDPRKLEDERKVVVGTLSGSEEPPPQKEIDAIDAGYKDAFNRLGPILAAGEDPQKAVESLYGPLRSSAKELALSGRHIKRDDKDPVEKSLLQEVVSAGKDVRSKKEQANAVQRGVDQIIPAVTNTPSLFRRAGAAIGLFDTPETTITPPTTFHTNAYSEPDAFKAMARVGAAEDRYNEAIKTYQDYLAKKKVVPAGGFELRSGARTNSPLKIGRFTVIPQ